MTAAKRAMDLVIAVVVGVVLSPVALVVAVLVRRKLGTPVLFRQARAGRHGAPFEILKFRTMTDARGPSGALLPDAERMTPLGSTMRATSLDELPELLNVVRGEMSLVGPRPLPVRYLDRYTPEQARRHDVAPGITGWAQVNGRNSTTWPERFEQDLWYVEHRSIWLDLKILVKTVLVVFARSDVAAEGHVTMPELTDQNTPAGGPPA